MAEGPVRLAAVGDTYVDPARVLAIVWVSRTSTAGDVAVVRSRGSGVILFEAVTDAAQTYLGLQFGQHGLAAPSGVTLTELSSGAVYVYLRED